VRNLLSLDGVLFTVLGYPMSSLEFFATTLNLLGVWLMTRRNIWTWPVSIVAVVLLGLVFYRIRLYSDLLEQGYYLATSVWGWWLWRREGASSAERGAGVPVRWNSPTTNFLLAAGICAASLCAGRFMTGIHDYFPAFFPAPASYPYLDAGTTVVSLVAQILMAQRRIECWVLWLAVDAVSVALYARKGVVFISLLYLIFLGLAFKGLREWRAVREVVESPR
jgi:nicotinamide mononucleotide transporter